MSSRSEGKTSNAGPGFAAILSAVVDRFKYVLLTLVVIVVAVILFYFVWSERQRTLTERSTVLVEEAQEMYTDWLNETEESAKEELGRQLVDRLELVLGNYPRLYAGQRALFLRADRSYELEDWSAASADFIELARRFPRSYLAPVALINAAKAAEELGDSATSLDLYQQVADRHQDSIQAPYARFSVGRLQEQAGDLATASETYLALERDHEGTTWAVAARNRLIYFQARGLDTQGN